MRLVLGLNDRYARTPDGAIWTYRSSWHYGNLKRYLEAFAQVLVIARVRDIDHAATDARRADGPGIGFARVPNFVGPTQYLLHYPALKTAVRGLVTQGDALVLRMPAWHLTSALAAAVPKNHPYGVEVCGDAAETLAGRARRSPLHALMRQRIVARTRALCRGAAAASYVTRHRLQSRFPPGPVTLRFDGCANVDLPPEAFIETSPPPPREGPIRLLFIGSMDTERKGADILIEALHRCAAQGLDATAELAGGGILEPRLVRRAAQLGLADRVRFVGHLPAPEAVRRALDEADLFVLPSRSEGLPRVLLEAMARGAPCLATRVGGIPELLQEQALVEPNDPRVLAQGIIALASDPHRRREMAQRNLAVAQGFGLERLSRCRREFQRAVADATLRHATATGSNHQ